MHTRPLHGQATGRYNGKMQIVNSEPPEWIMKGCLDKFRVNVESTVWTYGDTIYAPGHGTLPDHIIAHESMHEFQQAAYFHQGGKDAWWRRYLAEPRFRLEQEAEAYGVQYRFFCEHVKDRNRRALFLMQIAGHLSGPLYQVAISPLKARQLIEVLAGERQLA